MCPVTAVTKPSAIAIAISSPRATRATPIRIISYPVGTLESPGVRLCLPKVLIQYSASTAISRIIRIPITRRYEGVSMSIFISIAAPAAAAAAATATATVVNIFFMWDTGGVRRVLRRGDGPRNRLKCRFLVYEVVVAIIEPYEVNDNVRATLPDGHDVLTFDWCGGGWGDGRVIDAS